MTFAHPGGGSTRPPRRSRARRLSYAGLSAANRLMPKTDSVLLHSTIDLEDGVLALLDELASRGLAATVLLEDPAHGPALEAMAPGRVTTVPKRSRRGLWHFLTSRYVFTTETVFGDRPPPPNQVVVNIWHGEPPTKVVARFFPHESGIDCTYAPVCSTLGRAYRAAEFDLSPLQVPIVGAPRNDRMLRADSAAIRSALLGEEADLPTLLWLPTLREGRWGNRNRRDVVGEPYPGVPFATEEVRRIDDWLHAHGGRLVVKLHPHDVASFSGDYRAIRVLTQGEMEEQGLTIYPLLSAFDGLVTDVSSVWVDYLLLDKPMVFAFPDVEEYRQGRGINLEPFEDWVPGPFVRTADDLITALQDVVEGRDPMREERGRARRRFHRYTDDQSAARLLDGLALTGGA
jgi:CDP-glycerol glycerophosphotransferase